MTQEDIDFVTALVKEAGSSFYHGMKILPPARRDAMYGIYAFCRVVDDIADEDGDFAAKRVALMNGGARSPTCSMVARMTPSPACCATRCRPMICAARIFSP